MGEGGRRSAEDVDEDKELAPLLPLKSLREKLRPNHDGGDVDEDEEDEEDDEEKNDREGDEGEEDTTSSDTDRPLSERVIAIRARIGAPTSADADRGLRPSTSKSNCPRRPSRVSAPPVGAMLPPTILSSSSGRCRRIVEAPCERGKSWIKNEEPNSQTHSRAAHQ